MYYFLLCKINSLFAPFYAFKDYFAFPQSSLSQTKLPFILLFHAEFSVSVSILPSLLWSLQPAVIVFQSKWHPVHSGLSEIFFSSVLIRKHCETASNPQMSRHNECNFLLKKVYCSVTEGSWTYFILFAIDKSVAFACFHYLLMSCSSIF